MWRGEPSFFFGPNRRFTLDNLHKAFHNKTKRKRHYFLKGGNAVHVRPMNEAYAREITQWKYEAPYELYNLQGEEEELQELLHYSCVFEEDELIGFFCTGGFAQVHLGHEAGVYPNMDEIIDIGLGLKPEWTGQGFGREFLSFIIQHLQKKENPKAFRLTVAGFNERAIKLYRHLGFQAVTLFRANDIPFLVMIKMIGSESE